MSEQRWVRQREEARNWASRKSNTTEGRMRRDVRVWMHTVRVVVIVGAVVATFDDCEGMMMVVVILQPLPPPSSSLPTSLPVHPSASASRPVVSTVVFFPICRTGSRASLHIPPYSASQCSRSPAGPAHWRADCPTTQTDLITNPCISTQQPGVTMDGVGDRTRRANTNHKRRGGESRGRWERAWDGVGKKRVSVT